MAANALPDLVGPGSGRCILLVDPVCGKFGHSSGALDQYAGTVAAEADYKRAG